MLTFIVGIKLYIQSLLHARPSPEMPESRGKLLVQLVVHNSTNEILCMVLATLCSLIVGVWFGMSETEKQRIRQQWFSYPETNPAITGIVTSISYI